MTGLVARDLVVAYDGRPVLTGTSVDVAAGSLVVLTADDGAGCSTLLRVLAGTQRPDRGTVAGGPAALLAQPPGDEWAPHDSVAGLVSGPAGGLLERLTAGHLTEREMWMLSAGERQRVRLARILAGAEPVLLLDEPLGALDAAGVRTVLELLRGRAAAGAAVLAVCRDDPRAAETADRVVRLADGAVSG